MDQWQFEHWQRVREQGRRRFVWRTGVLGFGLAIFLGKALVETCIALYTQIVPPHALALTIINAALWGLAGYVFGAVLWWRRERQYRQKVASSA